MNISTRDECNTNNTDNLNNQSSAPREKGVEEEEDGGGGDEEESTQKPPAQPHHQDQGASGGPGIEIGGGSAALSLQTPPEAPSHLFPATTRRIISQQTTIRPIITTVPNSIHNNPPSVNAVRVLFRDQQLSRPTTSHSIRTIITPTTTTTTTTTATATGPGNNTVTRTPAAPIVSANRRLIERQIEAIQEADGRRWNFDFINCRPLNQIGHRYVHQPSLQQPWPSPAHQKGELQRHSDHKQDDD